jgi:hypothetical protein
LLALGLALVRVQPLPSVHGLRLGAPWFLEDFRLAVYYPTQAYWHGVNPYNSAAYLARYPVEVPFMTYAPATFLVYLPFGFLQLSPASAWYFGLTLILTFVLAAVALRASGYALNGTILLTAAGIILLSRPGQWNLLLGQVTLPVVLGVYAAVLLARRSPAMAGAGIVLSLLKPTFGVPLLPLLLASGAKRAVLWGLGLAFLVNAPLLGVLAAREGGIAAFVATLRQTQAAFAAYPGNDPLKNVWRADLPALITQIRGAPLGTGLSLVLAATVIGVACWGLIRVRSREDETYRLTLGLIACAVLLVVYHKAYDFLLLTLPAVAQVQAFRRTGADRTVLVLETVLLIILGWNYLASESALTALPFGPGARLLVVSANTLALLGLLGLYLYESVRAPAIKSRYPGTARFQGSSRAMPDELASSGP